MSTTKILPRVLNNLSDAKKLYQLQQNVLNGLKMILLLLVKC